MLSRVKKDDTVCVMTGKDKGKQGRVIAVYPKKCEVLIKGIGLVTRHKKARRQGETGGIVQEEKPVALSNVMPLCGACKRPSRVRVKVLSEGKKVRTCHRCQGEL